MQVGELVAALAGCSACWGAAAVGHWCCHDGPPDVDCSEAKSFSVFGESGPGRRHRGGVGPCPGVESGPSCGVAAAEPGVATFSAMAPSLLRAGCLLLDVRGAMLIADPMLRGLKAELSGEGRLVWGRRSESRAGTPEGEPGGAGGRGEGRGEARRG